MANQNGFPASTDNGVVTGPLGMMTMQFGDEADLLPPPAAERLRELRQQRDDAQLLVRSAHEETEDLRTEIQGHRNRLHRLRGPRGGGGFDLDEDDVRVASEQARLDKKMAELKRRSELGELRGERRRILSTAIKSAEDWVRSKPGGTAIAMHDPVEPELKKGEDTLAAIERIRRRGRELEADLARIAASPWPSAREIQKMREQIGQLAEKGRPWVEQAIANDVEIPFPTRTHQVRILNSEPSAIGFVELVDVEAITAWLHRDALIAALERAISEIAEDSVALDSRQRKEAEAQIRADLLAVQRQEAELVWKAQGDGAAVMHRPIDPRALLGVTLVPAPAPHDDDGQAGVARRA